MNKLTLASSAPIFLAGLKMILQEHTSFENIQVCLLGKELENTIQQDAPRLLIIDISQEKKEDQKKYETLIKQHPEIKIILLDRDNSAINLRRWLNKGVLGFASPSLSAEQAIEAVNKVSAGERYLSAKLYQCLANELLGFPLQKKKQWALTPREKQVLQLIIDEHTTREIAAKLYISPCTAETHRINIIQKLGVKNTAGIVREAMLKKLYV